MKAYLGVALILELAASICSAQTNPLGLRQWKSTTPFSAPEISIYPDTLFFETSESWDSVYVKNIGSAVLSIDSILTSKRYGWGIEVTLGDSVLGGNIPYGGLAPNFSIGPGDSAILAFHAPDLCPVCKTAATSAFFVDTLFVFSNDVLHSPTRIFAYGEGIQSAVKVKNLSPTSGFYLDQNYPNPFNPSTRIDFHLPQASRISLKIYNVLGQEIKILIDDHLQAGQHHVQWDGRDRFEQPAAAGIYLISLRAGDFVQTGKLTLIR